MRVALPVFENPHSYYGDHINIFEGPNKVVWLYENGEANAWCDKIIHEECGDELYFAMRKFPYQPVILKKFDKLGWQICVNTPDMEKSVEEDPTLWYRSCIHGRFWHAHEQEVYDNASVLLELGRAKNEDEAIRMAKEVVMQNEEKRIAEYLFLPEKLGIHPEDLAEIRKDLAKMNKDVEVMRSQNVAEESIEKYTSDAYKRIAEKANVLKQTRDSYMAMQQQQNMVPPQMQQQMGMNQQQYVENPYEQMMQQQQAAQPQMQPQMGYQQQMTPEQMMHEEQMRLFGITPNMINQQPQPQFGMAPQMQPQMMSQPQYGVNPYEQMMQPQFGTVPQMQPQAGFNPYQQQFAQQPMMQSPIIFADQPDQQMPFQQNAGFEQFMANQKASVEAQMQEFSKEMDEVYAQTQPQEMSIPNTDILYKKQNEENLNHISGVDYTNMSLEMLENVGFNHPNIPGHVQQYQPITQYQYYQTYPEMQVNPALYTPKTYSPFLEASTEERKAMAEKAGFKFSLDENGRPMYSKELPPYEVCEAARKQGIKLRAGDKVYATMDEILHNLTIPGTSIINTGQIINPSKPGPMVDPNYLMTNSHPMTPMIDPIHPEYSSIPNMIPNVQQPIVTPGVGQHVMSTSYGGQQTRPFVNSAGIVSYPTQTFGPLNPFQSTAQGGMAGSQYGTGEVDTSWMLPTKEEIVEGKAPYVTVRKGDKILYPLGKIEVKKKPKENSYKISEIADHICVIRNIFDDDGNLVETRFSGPSEEAIADGQASYARFLENNKIEDNAAHDIKDVAVEMHCLVEESIVKALVAETRKYDAKVSNELDYSYHIEKDYFEECKEAAIKALREGRAKDPTPPKHTILEIIDGKTQFSYEELVGKAKANVENRQAKANAEAEARKEQEEKNIFESFMDKCKPATDAFNKAVESVKTAVKETKKSSKEILERLQLYAVDAWLSNPNQVTNRDADIAYSYQSRVVTNPSVVPMQLNESANYAFWKKSMKNAAPKGVDYDKYFNEWWNKYKPNTQGGINPQQMSHIEYQRAMTKQHASFIDMLYAKINGIIDRGQEFMKLCEKSFRAFDKYAPFKCHSLYDFFHGEYGLGFMLHQTRVAEYIRQTSKAKLDYDNRGLRTIMPQQMVNYATQMGYMQPATVQTLSDPDIYQGHRQHFLYTTMNNNKPRNL